MRIISGVEEITLPTAAEASASGVGSTEESGPSTFVTASSEPSSGEQLRMNLKDTIGGRPTILRGSLVDSSALSKLFGNKKTQCD